MKNNNFMYKNTIVAILGLGVIVGLGFLIVNKNKQISEPVVNVPVDVVPEIPNISVNDTKVFNKAITLKINEQIVFSDGLVVKLKEINDSRCPKDVQCIWAGEISGLFEISGGQINIKNELRLGTENFKVQSQNGYTFTLNSATPKDMTLTVEYKKIIKPTGGCYLGGCSGQICSDRQDVYSTCEFKPEYICYQDAVCERQKTGQCGWTETETLKACLLKS